MTIRIPSKSRRFIALIPESLSGSFAVVATSLGVECFASTWPCSHIPTRRDGDYPPIRFDFAPNGDLQDVSISCDGEAISALSQDAQEYGGSVMDRRRQRRLRDVETQKHLGEGI